MKKRFSKLAVLLLTAYLAFTLLPATALAGNSSAATLSSDTLPGSELKNGYVYTVVGSPYLASTTGNGLSIAPGATVVINIPSGSTLTVRGRNGSGQTPGGAGILLPSGSTLILTGGGTLNATGGDSGAAASGNGGGTPYRSGTDYGNYVGVTFYSGGGGTGGSGAGSAGAGIGGAGATGGNGGAGAGYIGLSVLDNGGCNAGSAGANGSAGNAMGNLYVLESVTVNAAPGANNASTGGGGSGAASAAWYDNPDGWKGLGGGGGGQGGGFAGTSAAIGGSGGGGAGGGGGGGGLNSWSGAWSACYLGPGYGGNGGDAGSAGGRIQSVTGYDGYNVTNISNPYWRDGGSGGTGGSRGASGGNGTLYKSAAATVNGRSADGTASTHSAIQYTTLFDRQGGSGGTDSVTVAYGGGLPGPVSVPSRTGYFFGGYYTSAGGADAQWYSVEGTANANITYSVFSDTTLYAKWTPITYTVTYNGNGCTEGSTASSTHIYGTEKPLTANGFKKTGYSLAGWASSADGALEYTNQQSVKDLVSTDGGTKALFAKWTANQSTVTLDSQGGSGGADSVTATYDSPMPAASLPTRAGYAFNGYYTGVNGSGTQYYTGTGASARAWDVTDSTGTLYAWWTTLKLQTEGLADVTVTQGSVLAGAQDGGYTYYPVKPGAAVSLNAAMSEPLTNKVFLGWLGEITTQYDCADLSHTFVFPDSPTSELSMTGRAVVGTWSEDVSSVDTTDWPPTDPPVYRDVMVHTNLNGVLADMGTVTLVDSNGVKTAKTMQRVACGLYTYTAEEDTATTYKIFIGGEDTDKTLQFTASAPVEDFYYSSVRITTQLDGVNSDEPGTVYLKSADGALFATPQRLEKGVFEDTRLLSDSSTQYSVFVDGSDTGQTVKYVSSGNTATIGYFTATVTVRENDVPYNASSVELYSGLASARALAGEGGAYTGMVPTGIYDIYIDGADSSIDFSVTADNKTQAMDFYTVSYTKGADDVSGAAPATERYLKNVEVTVRPVGTLEKSGYTFSGWKDEADTVRLTNTSFIITAEKSLAAYWLPDTDTDARWSYDGGATWTYGSIAELTEAYNDATTGMTGVIQKDSALSLNMTLDANESLTIPAEKTLTVPDGKKLINNGVIANDGALAGNGTLENSGSLTGGCVCTADVANSQGKIAGSTIGTDTTVMGGTVDGGENGGVIDGATIRGNLTNKKSITNSVVYGMSTVDNTGTTGSTVTPLEAAYPANGTGFVTAAGGRITTTGKNLADVQNDALAAFGGMAKVTEHDGKFTLTLLGNVMLDSRVVLDGDVALDMNGYTLKGGAGTTAIEVESGMANISNGAVLGGAGDSGNGAPALVLTGAGSAVIGSDARLTGGAGVAGGDGVYAAQGCTGTVQNKGSVRGGAGTLTGGNGVKTPNSVNVFNEAGGQLIRGFGTGAEAADGNSADCGTIFNLGGTISSDGKDNTAPYGVLSAVDTDGYLIVNDVMPVRLDAYRGYPWRSLSEGVSFADVPDEARVFRFDGGQDVQAQITERTDSGAEAASVSVKKYYLSATQYDVYQLAMLPEESWAALPENGRITVPEETDAIEYLYVKDTNGNAAIYSTDGIRTRKANPDGLSSMPETIRDTTSDGVINGLDATKVYEYKKTGDTEWTQTNAGCTQITGLQAGNYEVRFKPSDGKEGGSGAMVMVSSKHSNEMVVLHYLSGLIATEGTAGQGKATYKAPYTTTLTANPGYSLPAAVDVKVTEDASPAILTAGTDYDYSSTGVDAGKITVHGDAVTGNIQITAVAAPGITSQPSNVSVSEGKAGRFTIAASGFGPLSYKWQRLTDDTGALWTDIDNANESIYTTGSVTDGFDGYQYRCIVTDVNGRSITSDAATLSVIAPPSVDITGDIAIEYGEGTELIASVTGSTGPYTYLWSTGGTTPVIAVSPASTMAYTVTVRDAGGSVCTDTQTVTVAQPVRAINVTPEYNEFNAKTLGYAATPAAQAFTITNSGNAAISGYTVRENGGRFIVAYTSAAIAPGGSSVFTVQPRAGLPAGVYRETINVATTEGVSADVTVAFKVNPLPIVNISGNTCIIAGDDTTLTAQITGGTGGYTYLWSTGDTTASIGVKPFENTQYTLTVTDSCGKTATAHVTVQVQAANYAITAAYADAAALHDFGTAAEGYATPAAQTVTVTNTGNRNVTLTVPSGTGSDYIIDTAATDLSLAPGESTVFSARPDTGLTAGAHNETLTVTTNHEAKASVSAKFAVRPALSVSIGGTLLVSSGDTTTLTALASGGHGNYTYAWSTGETTASVEASPTDTTVYTVTVMDDDGNTATANVQVLATGGYDIAVTPAVIDFGGKTARYTSAPEPVTVTIANNGKTAVEGLATVVGGSSFTVSGPGTAALTESAGETPSTTFTVQPKMDLPAGIYNEIISVNVGEDNYAAIPVTFTVNPTIPLSVALSGNTELLTGGETNITAMVTGGAGNKNYQWWRVETDADGKETVTPVEGATGSALAFGTPRSSTPGAYKYRVKVTDDNGEESAVTADVTITVQAKTHAVSLKPNANGFAVKTAGYKTAPDAQTITITNNGESGVSGYTITGGDVFTVVYSSNAISPNGTSTFTVQPVTGLDMGVYNESITVTTAEGTRACFVASFTVNPPPVVSIAGDLSIITGESTILTASASGGTGVYTYEWDTGDTGDDITVSPTVNTTYTVRVTDECGISATASVIVKVAAHSYAISAAPAVVDFGKQTFGYSAAPAAQIVTVQNTGDDAVLITGVKSNKASSNFIIAAAAATGTSLMPGQTATFTVQPKTGLATGVYAEAITVTTNKGTTAATVRFQVVSAPTVEIEGPAELASGETGRLAAVITDGAGPFNYLWNTGETTPYIDVSPGSQACYTVIVTDISGSTATNTVTMTVTPDKTYALKATPVATDFTASVGYTTLPEAQTVTVKNTGNSALVLVQPAGDAHFTVGLLSQTTLTAGAEATFTVQPATIGLTAGTYTLRIGIAADKPDAQAGVDARFTVSSISGSNPAPKPTPGLNPAPAPATPVLPERLPAVQPGQASLPSTLPDATMDKPIGEGGIGKPENMTDVEYLEALNDVLSDIEALLKGHIDAPLTQNSIDEADIENAEELYQAIWSRNEPDNLHLLDLRTGTSTVSRAYEDSKVPVLVAELLEQGDILDEAMKQVGAGKPVVVYDIKLLLDGVEIQPNGSIEITFSFKDYRGKDLTIAHQLSDSTWEFFDITVNAEGYAVITVNSLSPFAIYIRGTGAQPAPEETLPETEPAAGTIAPKPLEANHSWLWIMLLSVCFVLIIFFVIKRKRR